ncbi:MAG: hypothetical protein ACPHK8_02495 [Thermoplasmatota archaeon]
MNDTTTFFLAFLALFGGIAWYLFRLHQANHALAARMDALAATHKNHGAETGLEDS